MGQVLDAADQAAHNTPDEQDTAGGPAGAPSLVPAATEPAPAEEEDDPFDFAANNRKLRAAAEAKAKAKAAEAEAAAAPPPAAKEPEPAAAEDEDVFDFAANNRKLRAAAEAKAKAKAAEAEAAAAPPPAAKEPEPAEEEDDPFDFAANNRKLRAAAEAKAKAKAAEAEAAAAPAAKEPEPAEEEDDPFDFAANNRKLRAAAEAKAKAAAAAPKPAEEAPLAAPEVAAPPADEAAPEVGEAFDLAALAADDDDDDDLAVPLVPEDDPAPAKPETAPIAKRRALPRFGFSWLRLPGFKRGAGTAPKAKAPKVKKPKIKAPPRRVKLPKVKLPSIPADPKRRWLKPVIMGGIGLAVTMVGLGVVAGVAHFVLAEPVCAHTGVFCAPDPMVLANMTSAEIQLAEVRDTMRLTVNGELVEIAESNRQPRWVPILRRLKTGENTLLVQIDSRTSALCTGTFSLRINGTEIHDMEQRWYLKLADGKPGNCLTKMMTLSVK